MPYDSDDTICAIATATGSAARGMVRVSGPRAVQIVDSLFHAADGRRLDGLGKPATITGHLLTSAEDSVAGGLPCDLFLWPTTRSYTRQPVAELHTIGSPPLLQSLLAELCRAGARLAEPGEFTLRAFLAGRLDLTQAEAVLGVIDANGEDELNHALAQLAGGVAKPLQQLRSELLQILAELEAGLDFVDEDIEFISPSEMAARFESASDLLDDVALQMTSRYVAAGAPQVALVGRPNVGKSSLFNALVARYGVRHDNAGRPSIPALVSPARDTTRDYLTAILDLGDVRCELVDTAGVDGTWNDDIGPIEAASQSHATERRTHATIRVCCIDSTDSSRGESGNNLQRDITVFTKADIGHAPRTSCDQSSEALVVATSSRTGEGLGALRCALLKLLTLDQAAQRGQVVSATAERCQESIRLAAASLRQAQEIIGERGGDELVAAEIRDALAEIGRVVGAVCTDDLLDRVFSTFCIGK